jgi:hypothetical protein
VAGVLYVMLNKLTFTGYIRLGLLLGLSACLILVIVGSSVPIDLIPLPILFLAIYGIYKSPIEASRVLLVLGSICVGHSIFYSHFYMTNPNINNPFDSMTAMWISYSPLLLILLGFLILAFSKNKVR